MSLYSRTTKNPARESTIHRRDIEHTEIFISNSLLCVLGRLRGELSEFFVLFVSFVVNESLRYDISTICNLRAKA